MSEQDDPGIGSRVSHPDFGAGVIINIKPKTYHIVFMEKGKVEVAKNNTSLEITDVIDPSPDMVSLADVERIFLSIIKQYSDLQETVSIGEKWKGGKLILQPANPNLQPKEIPVETFFHKITMLRDRLRVMEQRVNASKNLDEEEKVNLQQYITRIYGSLTTFNVLFKDQDSQFKGEGSK